MPILDPYGRPLPNAARRAASARRARRRADINAAYDAAQTTNENAKHWRWADSLSASEANSPGVRQTIRERARYEVANNSFADGMVDTLAADTIGTGPQLQSQTDNRDVDKALERRWQQWCNKTRLAKKLRTARRAKTVDGEAFLQRIDNPRTGLPVTLDVLNVECDQFENLTNVSRPDHVSGIYFDESRNPVRYDYLENHPGDPLSGMRQGEPLSAEDVIHVFDDENRPGQVRGVSELTPALPLFAMLRRYTLAVLLAAENAADQAALLETQSPPLDDDTNFDGDDIDPFDAVPLDRGMLTALPRGWKMSQLKPEQPTTTYVEFRNAILNEIARCLGMPFNVAAANSAEYNFASAQIDHGPYYHLIKIERSNWELLAVERIFQWWLAEALLIPGYLPPGLAPDVPHHWYWGHREHGDPIKRSAATKTLHGLNLVTDEAWLLEEGIDPEEHHQQLLRQARRRRELQEAAGLDANGQPADAANSAADAA